MASKGSAEEQNQLLEAALQNVKMEAIQLQRCMDKRSLMDSVKHASKMISELRTSLLSPRRYFELYITLTGELQQFSICLQEEFEVKGSKINDLYELVQYAGHILPRLYLLVTVGSVFIRAHPDRRQEILKDLVEMCRGVQHPLRGLFLRQYLLQSTKDLLPDSLVEEQLGYGVTSDSMDFILLNFAEMNKLWVRMQHQTHSRDRAKCEKERKELKQMVGTNLERLSQLESIDADTYKSSILSALMEQIVNCRDPIAQEYLLECIIQVFPDEFHLGTLNVLLKGCAQLHTSVNVKNILNSLIDRLADYATNFKDLIPKDIQLFDIFSAHVTEVINARPDMFVEDVVSLQTSLTNLALKCFPERVEYVDKMFDYCNQVFINRDLSSLEGNIEATNELVKMCKLPIENYENIAAVMELPHYSEIWQYFGFETRKSLSLYIVNRILLTGEKLSSVDHVNDLLDLISPLVSDQEDQPKPTSATEADFIEEQSKVASLVHRFCSDDLAIQYQILVSIRKKFGTGGIERIKYTLPTVVFAALRLISAYYAVKDEMEEENYIAVIKKLFQYTFTTVRGLAKAPSQQYSLAFRLSLECSKVFDKLNFEEFTYELILNALKIYESEISDSKDQVDAIVLLVGTLATNKNFCHENFDRFSTKAAIHSAKLIDKKDQYYCVSLSAHLFWNLNKDENGEISEEMEKRRDGSRVLECLQREVKIAEMCIGTDDDLDSNINVKFFVEILNHYLYFYEQGNEFIKVENFNALLKLIEQNLDPDNNDDSPNIKKVRAHFNNTINYIQKKKETDEKFANIIC